MRQWTITVAVDDHDDGAAFTEAMMESYTIVQSRLSEDVPRFRMGLRDTHGDPILGYPDPASSLAGD